VRSEAQNIGLFKDLNRNILLALDEDDDVGFLAGLFATLVK